VLVVTENSRFITAVLPSFKIFEIENNGAKSMLCDWNNDRNNYLEKLVKELGELKRDDVADLLQKEIDKKGESCNCPNCGHIV
jgi:hypothetical protein